MDTIVSIFDVLGVLIGYAINIGTIVFFIWAFIKMMRSISQDHRSESVKNRRAFSESIYNIEDSASVKKAQNRNHHEPFRRMVFVDDKPGKTNINGLVDALTGQPIDKSKDLFICKDCGVIYEVSSLTALRNYNSSMCASCGSKSLRKLNKESEETQTRND